MLIDSNHNRRLLLTEEKIKQQYNIEVFILNVWKILIGVFLLLSFILPAINEQGKERRRDIDIALYSMIAGVMSSVIMLLLEKMPFLSDKQRDVLHMGLNHFRSDTYDVGILLEFLHGIAGLLAEVYGNDADWLQSVSNWFSGNSIGTRAAIAGALVFVKTLINTFVTYSELKKQNSNSDDNDERDVLLHINSNRRDWSKYSRMRWVLDFLSAFGRNYVLSALLVFILEGFNVGLSVTFKRIYPFIMAALAILHFIPDHPFVSKYESVQQLKKASRFLDKFLVTALFNFSLAFMFHMDLVALFAGQQTINVKTSTAATTLLADGILAWHASDIYYRIASVLNDVLITVSALLKNWNFTAKLAKATVGWAKVFAANPYAAIPSVMLAALDFVSDFVDTQKLTLWKRIVVEMADSVNHGLLNAGLLLTNIESSSVLIKNSVAIPAAVLFTLAREVAKHYPLLNKLLSPIDYGLLGAGIFQFIAFLNDGMPSEYIKYSLIGALAAAMASGQLYDYLCWRNKKQPENKSLLREENNEFDGSTISSPSSPVMTYRTTPKTTQENKKSTSLLFFGSKTLAKAAPYIEAVSSTIIFLMGIAVFDQAMQAYDDGNTTDTGRTMMKLLVGFCAFVMLCSLFRNSFYKSSANNFNNNNMMNPEERSCLAALDIFGVCKKVGGYIPLGKPTPTMERRKLDITVNTI